MKPLIIGEAPSKNLGSNDEPCGGRIGRRLAGLTNMTYEQYLAFFDRVNLLTERQDSKEKGFTFDAEAGWAAANDLRYSHPVFSGAGCGHRVALLLGKRVAKAFDHEYVAYFDRWFIEQATVYTLPHPSGVNRWWNDEANRRKAAEFMQWLAFVVEHGSLKERFV